MTDFEKFVQRELANAHRVLNWHVGWCFNTGTSRVGVGAPGKIPAAWPAPTSGGRVY